MSFLISASESALVGRALEEYLQARADDDGVCFLDFLWSRVGPFSPPIARDRCEGVDDDDMPDDVEWEGNDIGMRFGFAPSQPNSWFLGGEDTSLVVRITRDRSARSLVDLISELVAQYVAKGPADDARFNLVMNKGEPWGRLQQRGAMSGPFKLRESRQGTDDAPAIELAFRQLIGQSEKNCGTFFDVGRTIGRVLADCHRYESLFLEGMQGEADDDDFLPIDAATWRARAAETLLELAQNPIFEPFSNASTCLGAAEQAISLLLDPNDWRTEFRKLLTVMEAVWLAYGEILHSASKIDDSLAKRGERPTTPRMLRLTRLTRDSSTDKIRATLQLYEGLFDDRAASVFPEQIVAGLANGIEALARRVWPKTFASQGPKADVGSVLLERCRNGDDQERRFASIANMLYKTYRNASQHDFDNFRCTWQEAFFFFCGMQQLWQLSEELADPTRRPG